MDALAMMMMMELLDMELVDLWSLILGIDLGIYLGIDLGIG